MVKKRVTTREYLKRVTSCVAVIVVILSMLQLTFGKPFLVFIFNFIFFLAAFILTAIWFWIKTNSGGRISQGKNEKRLLSFLDKTGLIGFVVLALFSTFLTKDFAGGLFNSVVGVPIGIFSFSICWEHFIVDGKFSLTPKK